MYFGRIFRLLENASMTAPSDTGVIRNHSELLSLFGQFCRDWIWNLFERVLHSGKWSERRRAFYPLAGHSVSSALYSNSTSGEVSDQGGK